MKSITRLSSGIIAVVLIIACFSGCGAINKGKYSLNGKNISEYKIVVPEKADICEQYAAELLLEGIKKLTENELPIVKDTDGSSEYEILVGNTNRAESKTSEKFGMYEYSYYTSGKKTVLLGNSYTVSGGIPAVMSAISDSKSVSSEKKVYSYTPEETKSVILLIGDGMGKNHIKLAEAQSPKTLTTDGVTVPDEKGGMTFAAGQFPNIGDVTTQNIEGKITDSAAAATALATGSKTFNGVLGMIPDDLDSDGNADELVSAQNVREAASLRSMKTAVLSTDRDTGATPNAFLVHYSDRYALSAIVEQRNSVNDSKFAPDFVWSGYDSESFCDSFKTALNTVDCKAGFFVMAEEAMIDKYASRLDFDNVIRTVKRLDNIVRLSMTYVICHPDTAVIVTADHETGGLAIGDNGEFSWESDGEHTETPVGIYAIGEGTEIFSGKTVDNTDIAKYIFNVIEK